MGKVLFWVVVVIVALTVLRIIASRASTRKQPPGARPQPASRPARGAKGYAKSAGGPVHTAAAGGSEQMVRCAHCGIHMPRSDAILTNGHTWCSQGHALLGVRD